MKAQTIYTIPFSKAKVDQIIANSAHSDKNTGIVFTVKFASEDCPWSDRMPTRCQFNYDNFVLDWDKLYLVHTKPSVKAHEDYEKFKAKTSRNLTFEPT